MNGLETIKTVSKLVLVSCLLLVLTFAGVGTFNTSQIANAATINKLPLVVAADASSMVDKMTGAGTSNKTEGNANEAAGVVKRNVGDASDDLSTQAEGAAQQAKGKFQQGAGELQNQAEKAASDLEDSTDSLFDSVKNIFQGQ